MLLDAVGPTRHEPVFRALTKILHPDAPTGDGRLQQQLSDAQKGSIMTDRRWLAGQWRGVYDVDRPADWCRGCGYHRAVHGAHRADCTAVTPPRCGCGAQLVLPRSRALGCCEECAVAGETSGEPISEQEAIATVRSVFPGARIISTGPIAQHPKMSAGHGGEKGSEMNIHYHLVSRIIPTSATDSTEEVL